MAEHGFHAIIGHKAVIRQLQSAIENDRVSHAYLLTGDEGIGKRTVAEAFSAALLCQSEGEVPCGECLSCRKAADHNHPDIIWLHRGKPNTISVDEIRQQVVNTVGILPYESARKIYVIPEAEKMTPGAQNALLKTIEEPPEYAVIILLCSSPEALLQTIRSRCVILPLLPVSDREVTEYLMTEVRIPDYEARVITAFAQGNIGRAKEAAVGGAFAERRDKSIGLIRRLHEMDTAAMAEAIRLMKEEKNEIGEILDIFRMWFRDVLYFKATAEIDQLIFVREISTIRAQAAKASYPGLTEILDAIDTCQTRLRSNVNFELALELLLFTIKENCNA